MVVSSDAEGDPRVPIKYLGVDGEAYSFMFTYNIGQVKERLVGLCAQIKTIGKGLYAGYSPQEIRILEADSLDQAARHLRNELVSSLDSSDDCSNLSSIDFNHIL